MEHRTVLALAFGDHIDVPTRTVQALGDPHSSFLGMERHTIDPIIVAGTGTARVAV
jgi:hypothetical protein